jgi:calpain-15
MKYEWRRASEVIGPGMHIFEREMVSPKDIVQGFCGDCYFLSSISSLAEYPERVKNIFLTKEVN